MESDILIKTIDLSRHYKVGEEEVIALDKVNLEIERNKICAILGTSGSGKSTLLNMLAGIERPSGGEVYIGKYRIDNLSEGIWQNSGKSLQALFSSHITLCRL